MTSPTAVNFTDRFDAPWHRASFDRFLNQRLPELLAERLPLAAYTVQQGQGKTCHVTVEIAINSHTLLLDYPDLPQPNEQGTFEIEDHPHIVVPFASQEELDKAEVKCVGERLYDYIAARLGKAPSDIAWDESMARAFLPLDTWFAQFLQGTAQWMDTTNWHARYTHLRRILIVNDFYGKEYNDEMDAGLSRSLQAGSAQVIAPGQMGRVDPFETPEGAYIGHIFTIAVGAEIRDGKIIITDSRPEAGLGQNALMIPFIEHDDANRLLMGSNMMRQGLVSPEAEPAWVQTGHEPRDAGPDFWCGRNLLTAFVAWGEGCVEDGLILSESCARHLNYPYPAEPGDKLANRHGLMGVVSQILPDDQMPHLADGTPVEIAYSFGGIHARMSFGLVREAVMGRVAQAEGQPAIVPSFHAPSAEEIRARLVAAGLPETGMEHLRTGKDGSEMPYPSTVGWVYWYRLAHLARRKMQVIGAAQTGEIEARPYPVPPTNEASQGLSELEIGILRQVGALQIAHEALTMRSVRWQGGDGSSPYLCALARRLAAAGLVLDLKEEGLSVRFQSPEGEALQLARPLSHPWLPEQLIERIGQPPTETGPAARQAYAALVQANDRLARWLAAQTSTGHSTYLDNLMAQLETRFAAYLEALLSPDALKVYERQTFNGRAVIAPGVGLHLDQVGLPDEIIQGLFADRAAREGVAPDDLLANSWVIIHRAPSAALTALVAFHPLRVSGPAIRLHPLVCAWLNADFDGDQVAVHLPLGQAAQAEAGQRLSVAGHLARDPGLVETLTPPLEGIWGLAYRSLTPDGRREIAKILQMPESNVSAPFSKAGMAAALRALLDHEGSVVAIRAAEALAQMGYAACKASGASLSPFPVSQVPLPPQPVGNDREVWESYIETCAEAILSGHDYANPNLGPQLLAAAVRPRSRRSLPFLLVPFSPMNDAEGNMVILRHALAEGRTPQELFTTVAGARPGLARLIFEYERILQEPSSPDTGAISLLARARRARRPGIIFARAAASGEIDPLADVETRLLVGLV
jgi:hypothetical protein